MKIVRSSRIAVLVCLLVTLGGVASAGTIAFTTAGWYAATASSRPGSTSYFVGVSGGTEFRDFFTFDLTGQSGSFSSATLTVTNRQSTPTASSTNDSDTFSVFMTGETVSALNAGTAAFTNLASGSPVGGFAANFNTLTDGQQLVIALNDAALAAINAQVGIGTFTLGGAVTTAASGNNFLFVGANGGSDAPQAGDVFLTLSDGAAVPEPGALALVGSALVGLVALRRRRKV